MYKNLIFDIDGTLWNSTPIAAKAWTRAAKESGVDKIKDMIITDKILQKEFGKPMDVIADDLFGDIDKDAKAKLLENCCRLEHEYLEANEEDISYPDMRETMKRLSLTHRIFIVSNCQTGYIELVMKKNKITELVEDFECFGATGLSKGENISLVMKRNGLSKEETVYIGDTYGDYVASKDADIPFLFASYGFGAVETPDLIANSFSQIEDMV